MKGMPAPRPVRRPARTGAMQHAQRLLFLPGAGGSPEFWRPLGDLLPAHLDKRYLAWPGLGNQPHSPSVRDFDDLVALVLAELGDEPVDLLAQSMGGAVALRVALEHPQRVRRLLLAVTSGGLDVSALGGSDWRANYRASFPRAASWITETWPDYTNELGRVRQPTLLLWGDADPISPVAVGEQLRRVLPHAVLQVIEGGDHDIVATRAHEVLPHVLVHLGLREGAHGPGAIAPT